MNLQTSGLRSLCGPGEPERAGDTRPANKPLRGTEFACCRRLTWRSLCMDLASAACEKGDFRKSLHFERNPLRLSGFARFFIERTFPPLGKQASPPTLRIMVARVHLLPTPGTPVPDKDHGSRRRRNSADSESRILHFATSGMTFPSQMPNGHHRLILRQTGAGLRS
jgi:hypothetical protein